MEITSRTKGRNVEFITS